MTDEEPCPSFGCAKTRGHGDDHSPGSLRVQVDNQERKNKAAKSATPQVWVSYHHDMGVHIDGIFDNELDALRHAVGNGYQHVAGLQYGEVGVLP